MGVVEAQVIWRIQLLSKEAANTQFKPTVATQECGLNIARYSD